MMTEKKFFDSFTKNLKTMKSGSVVIFLKDLDGKIIFISDSIKNIFNSDISYVGKKPSDIYPKLKKIIVESDDKVLKSGEAESFTVEFPNENNDKTWLRIDKTPYKDSNDKIIGLMIFLTDITSKTLLQIETKQLNQILNAHLKVEEVLKNITDVEKFPCELSKTLVDQNIFTAVMIERINDFQTKDVSQYACWFDNEKNRQHITDRQLGFTKCLETFLKDQKNPFSLHNTHKSCPWNNMYKRTNSYVSTIVYGSKIYGSVCIRLTDGWQFGGKSKILMEQLVDKIAFGFYTLETQVQINSIKEEMEERLKLYKMALDATNDGIWDWNLITDKMFYSDRYFEMLGYKPNDFPHTLETWKSLIHEDDLDLVYKIIQMEIENKSEGFEIEFRMKTKDDDYIWILGRGKVYKRSSDRTPLKIIGTHVDITDLKMQGKELEQKNDQLENANEELIANNEEIMEMNKELERLYEEQEELSNQTSRMLKLMGQIALFGTNEKSFLDECLDLVFNMISASTSGKISLLEGDKYRIMTATGISQLSMEDILIKKEAMRIPSKSKILSRKDIFELYTVDVFLENKLENSLSEVKEGLITPITWNGIIRGCIEIFNENDSDITFAFSDLKRMDSFSNLLSVFYRLRKYMKDEGKFQTDLILTLVKALEYYDEYTRGHSERVASWSVELAKALGVDSEGQRQIYFVSLMHDIGKIFVPQSVLNKVSRLTEDEYSIIQSHSAKSAELINKVEGMENFANIVLHHHEKYDGSGYPDGLKGKAIPYFSRIISVADSYDAMTSTRPYRKPLSKEYAVNELLRCKGSQFDPTLIDPFIEKVINKEE